MTIGADPSLVARVTERLALAGEAPTAAAVTAAVRPEGAVLGGPGVLALVAEHANQDQLDPTDHHDADDKRRVAGHVLAKKQCLKDDPAAKKQRGHGEQHAQHAGDTQRRHGERGQPFDR